MNRENYNREVADELNLIAEVAEDLASELSAELDLTIDLTLDEVDEFTAAISTTAMTALDAAITTIESQATNSTIVDLDMDVTDGVTSSAVQPIEPMDSVILTAQQQDLAIAYGQLITHRMRLQFGQHWPISVTCHDISDPTGVVVKTINPMLFNDIAYYNNFNWTSLQGIYDALLDLQSTYGFDFIAKLLHHKIDLGP